MQAFDPEGHERRQKLLTAAWISKDDPYDVADGADVLVIITEWDQFRALDLDRIKRLMKKPVLVDLHQYLQARRHAFLCPTASPTPASTQAVPPP